MMTVNNQTEGDMSTRAIYTFYDSANEVHVYKHHVNTGIRSRPEGMAEKYFSHMDAKTFALRFCPLIGLERSATMALRWRVRLMSYSQRNALKTGRWRDA